MANQTTAQVADTIALAKAEEELRQARETFDQRKVQDRRWFAVRLAMGWVAVVLLPGLGVVAAWTVYNHAEFPPSTVSLAAAALFADIIGVVVAVWRVVMGRSPEALEPTVALPAPLPKTGESNRKHTRNRRSPS